MKGEYSMDIVINGVYSNGKRGILRVERKVLGIGREYIVNDNQQDKNGLKYVVVKGEEIGLCFRTTLGIFSDWARERIIEI